MIRRPFNYRTDLRTLLLCLRLLCFTALTSVPLILQPAAAQAQSRGEEEARRQLEFARQEVTEGNYEKALASADSALRLFPALYEAYVYKALAYEGLGKLKMAESFLLTYQELMGGIEDDEVASEALERIQDKLGRGDEPEGSTDPTPSEGDTSSDPGPGPAPVFGDMPAYPSGSEEFLGWLVTKQRMDTLETRKDIGGGLMAGGLALAGVGAGLMVSMAVISVDNPNDANVEAMYAAGVASIMGGGTLAVIGIPTMAISAGELSRMQKEQVAVRPQPRLELGPTSLALRF
jgi:hypothetical protein